VERIAIPLLHCYRCGNVWTPVKRLVRQCPRCKSFYWDEPRIRIPTQGDGLGIQEILEPHRKSIERIAKKYGVRELRVFGSVARNQAKANSDVDLLVDFAEHPSAPGSRRYLMRRELERLLGREVELVTEENLHWFIQPQVIAESVPL
jgi:hypothetical protein